MGMNNNDRTRTAQHNRRPITARNARRLEKKKNKWQPVYGWEGEIICEKKTIEQKPELTYDEIKTALGYFEKYGVNI